MKQEYLWEYLSGHFVLRSTVRFDDEMELYVLEESSRKWKMCEISLQLPYEYMNSGDDTNSAPSSDKLVKGMIQA